jgi:hypothetical protein
VRHHVILVPGFFGFGRFGDLPYFAHVQEVLHAGLGVRGVAAEVHKVPTPPTASLAQRAARLAEAVHALCPGDEPIHLIGHSSGGLDARLLVAPGSRLPADVDVESLAGRVRTVTTVATPHRGTPVAAFFTGAFGQRLLQIFSLATIHSLRYGKLPLGILARLVGVFARIDDVLRLEKTVLDQLYDQLLSDFSDDRRQALHDFFHEVGKDQALVPQLTPDNMEVFDASVADRGSVAYGCVTTMGRRPGVRTVWKAGIDPYAQLTHGLYAILHSLSTRFPKSRRPGLATDYRIPLLRYYPKLPELDASDGVVPTLSQLHGQLLFGARADHLDVIGHFDDPEHFPPHYDWLSSGSGFRRMEFERLWTAVMDFIVEPLA